MNQETKICQNCKREFIIDPADFDFYKKISVPPPTWCPECRMIRRQIFRNERSLYKRACELCKKSMVMMYAPEKQFIVYCNDCYQSDRLDALKFGREYDFNKPFFAQFADLMKVVPRRALYIDFGTNSDYTNWSVYINNSYLVFGGHHYENCISCAQDFYLTDCVDTDFSQHSEQCYNSIHLRRCNRVHNSFYSEDCANSWFLYGCRNCTDCVGCTNLRNKSYYIFNQQYSKEEYQKKLAELRLDSWTGIKAVSQKFFENTLEYPRKYAWVRNVVNSTGDNLERVKNCIHCFHAAEDEDCRYSFFVPSGAKQTYDVDHVGLGAELTYELMSGFGISRVVFGNRVYYTHDAYYSDDCFNSANLFGCIGLRKKEYCILNKQYTKEEYDELVPRIIEHMEQMPYTDKKGRVYTYGEFFPLELSPFAYNETVAQEYFPLTEKEVSEKGYEWRKSDLKTHTPTLGFDKLPDSIKGVADSIVEEAIGCEHEGKYREQCTGIFRVIKDELRFYKKLGIPLPRLCPNCRHAARLAFANPADLIEGKCECGGRVSLNGVYANTSTHFHGETACLNQFKTPFSGNGSEVVYCEQCYQAEVA
ncbi:MAG: hypothetical protein A3B25_03735 [Candidatus Ryanbacteria bacterium RIFCSPLOWO2_01_FULL_48_26]|uniref:Zinc-binding domain-containing protein n=1 Tax=Candidatus Ryanbacteria bacterium RIFCSPLOWO2_01_FULL_48_26 TaxID=1802126 RepID=A0A1G2GT76_9BACT|nr:MAG: hypothetical protein A3B25_03735 [Candidatus Ryanbacteria bacterium RIFCSPLOWO2_01_FULL_48_26]